MNVIWNEWEFKNMTKGYLDCDTTRKDLSVCEVNTVFKFLSKCSKIFYSKTFRAGKQA